jgi:hypothetical protein
LDFWVEGGLGARKRCGEGVWIGIVWKTWAIAAALIWQIGGVECNYRGRKHGRGGEAGHLQRQRKRDAVAKTRERAVTG